MPNLIPASALGLGATPPSERVSLALIGCGGRGMGEGTIYTSSDRCQMVAVCDPREDRRTSAQQRFNAAYAARASSGAYKGCAAFNDFRDVLARPDVDGVYIATADHWHVPITIAAALAGKDMHTEKPLGISIEQDLAALRAVRRYGRVFQYGTERRSTPQARHAIELVLNGRIGKVQSAIVISPPSVQGGSATPVLPVPGGWDYDLWLGPAPEAPFCNDRCIVSGNPNGIFHIYDYAIGFIAGWAAHPLDLFQWWADNAGLTTPVHIEGTGTLPASGLFNCITSWDVRCRYENGFDMRFLDNTTAAKHPGLPGITDHNAATFIGEKGWLSVSYSKLLTSPASLKDSIITPDEIHLQRSASHQLTWAEQIRTRQDPVSNIETAVRSDLISHLSDICIRVGRPIRWDNTKQTIVGDEAAQRMMCRPMRAPWQSLMKAV
ncbi:MAG: Gfo/Idh/MocA family oxidoreductase [Verrucomicrobia bacterium]|nr:Gfo/Idh/MocA family oxidoreductase [Verrucomicrobiota bacterium]